MVQVQFGRTHGLRACASRAKATTAKATAASKELQNWYGPSRKTWLPDFDPPSWLDGTMPGDHGCDFLGICSNPSTIDQFRRGEVINGRFAMLGTVGMLVPEILADNGVDIKGAVWFETGSAMLHGQTLNYFGIPVPLTLQAVIIINAALVFLAEWFRFQEFAPGFEPQVEDSLYPGGAFDPLGLSENPDDFAIYKVNEVRNGRLAMTGFLGFAWQGYITRVGPYQNLKQHISDPYTYNIFTTWPTSGAEVALNKESAVEAGYWGGGQLGFGVYKRLRLGKRGQSFALEAVK